jgi:hypothetical protein
MKYDAQTLFDAFGMFVLAVVLMYVATQLARKAALKVGLPANAGSLAAGTLAHVLSN